MFRIWPLLCAARRVAISALIFVLAIVIATGRPNLASAQDVPIVAKSFGAASITVGASTSLTIRIQGLERLTGVALTDTLPEGLVVATPNGLTGTCQGAFATVTGAPGSNSIGLAGGTLEAGIGCELSLNVTAVTAGTKTNSVAATSDQGAGRPVSASIMVEQAATTTTIASSANPSAKGQSVTFTATVTGPGRTPTGTVTFQDGSSANLGTLSATGTATYTTTALSAGGRTVTAVYGGDAAFAGSTSLPLTQAVDKAPSATTVTSSTNPSVARQSVTFTATVTGPGGAPTGSVTFHDGSAALGTATLSADGNATLSISTLTSGSYTIIAAYAGDSNFATSASSPHTQTIQKEIRMGNGLPAGVVLFIVIVLVALLLLLRKFAFLIIKRVFTLLGRLIGGVVKFLSKPIARVLRLLRIISRAQPSQPPAIAVQSVVGLSVVALAQAFSGETEQAIAKDFDTNSIKIQRNKQFFCTWLSPLAAQHTPYDKKKADEAFKSAGHFFNVDIEPGTNPLNLSDDIDGAFIVNLLKDSDKVCFHVLSEFKKTINANVIALSVLFSVIVSIVAVANVLLSTAIDFYALFALDKYLPFNIELLVTTFQFNVSKEVFNKGIFGVLSCLSGFFVMWFYYHTEYAQFQRYNGQQMNNFLVEYLAGINIDFRQIHTNATQTVLEEEGVEQMKADTFLWITNLQWTAFRAFFIESYLKNILFQIRRNSSYYLLLIPLFFILAMLIATYAFNIKQFNVLDFESDVYRQNTFYVFFAWLLFTYYGYLKRSVSFIWESIEARRWFKFRELNIQDAMKRIMESYVIQLDRWRSMMKSRG